MNLLERQGMIYVRHNRTVAFAPRKFGPKTDSDLSVGEFCPACLREFCPGDFTTLMPVGPGDDKDAQRKAIEGRWYNAVAVEVHWDCAGISEETDGN